MTPATCRAARSLLDWKQQRLADAARIGISTLKHYESGGRTLLPWKIAAIRATLEDAGVAFIEQHRMGPGVRLRERTNDLKPEQKPAGKDVK